MPVEFVNDPWSPEVFLICISYFMISEPPMSGSSQSNITFVASGVTVKKGILPGCISTGIVHAISDAVSGHPVLHRTGSIFTNVDVATEIPIRLALLSVE